MAPQGVAPRGVRKPHDARQPDVQREHSGELQKSLSNMTGELLKQRDVQRAHSGEQPHSKISGNKKTTACKPIRTRTGLLWTCTGPIAHAYYIKSRSFFGSSGLFISRHKDPTVVAAWTTMYAARPGIPTWRVS